MYEWFWFNSQDCVGFKMHDHPVVKAFAWRFCRREETYDQGGLALPAGSGREFGLPVSSLFFSSLLSIWALADLSEGEAHFSPGY
jgi:hypothetical protein